MPVSSGLFCEGPVTFTCVGTEISPNQFWVVNGESISSFPYEPIDFPFQITFNSQVQLSGVMSEVTHAVVTSDIRINITVTLTASNISVLDGVIFQCEDSFESSNSFSIVYKSLCKYLT